MNVKRLLSTYTVKEGQSVSYLITANDNVGVAWFSINEEDIQMIGFSADILITEEDAFQRKVTFSNIVSTSEQVAKYFTLYPGVATDGRGNESQEISSPAFKIK